MKQVVTEVLIHVKCYGYEVGLKSYDKNKICFISQTKDLPCLNNNIIQFSTTITHIQQQFLPFGISRPKWYNNFRHSINLKQY